MFSSTESPVILAQPRAAVPLSSRKEPGVRDTPGVARPLLLLLLLGAVLRLALWGWFQDRPIRIADEKDYNAIALNLLRHGEFSLTAGSPTSIRPPLYPAVVAAVYGVFGAENFQAVRLLQAALSLLTVVLLYGLGSKVYSRRVGWWLAGLYCFYPSLLGANNLLLTEVLFTLLLMAGIYAVVLAYHWDSVSFLVLAGLLLGCAALTRSVVWLSPPFLAGFLVVTGKGPLRRRALGAAALLAAFAAVLAPWVVRNTRLQQTLVAIDVMGGRNFMMGNYRHTPLYRSWDAISLEGDQSWIHEVTETSCHAERNTQGKIDKLALRQGLRFVRENPGLTLRRDLVKFFDFWGLERELVAGAGQGYFGPIAMPVLIGLALIIWSAYAGAMFLGLFGAVLAPPADRRLHWLFLLVVAFICGMHTLAFGHSRYHLPVMPLILLYAASGLLHARVVWARRRHWSFWLACGLCGILVAGWVWSASAIDLALFRQLVASGI